MHSEHFENQEIDLPLAEVECDRTLCDLLVVDDGGKVVLGQPQLLGVRDRCTDSIIGMSIAFEEPGRVALLNGIRHMMHPKDMSEHPGVRAWPMFGNPHASSSTPGSGSAEKTWQLRRGHSASNSNRSYRRTIA